MLMRKLMWTRRRLLAVAVACVVLVAGLIVLLQVSQVAEAAVLNPHPGLVGWWRFDEGVGSSAKDSSGFGNDGTVYGAAWVDGKYGKALSFDGIDDYMETSATLSTENAITVSAWIYPSLTDNNRGIVQIHTEAVNNYHALYIDDANYITWEYIDGGGVRRWLSFAYATQLDMWQHIALTHNYVAQEAKLYVNGNLVQTKASLTVTPITNRVVRIGWCRWSPSWFKGIIDEVRIYNRVLSEAEIQEIFQKGPDFSSRLLAKVPRGTTQVIVTLSWQGIGTINVTIESPSKSYTEGMVPVYQKTVYSTSGGTSSMLNIKRLSVSVTALSSDENWYIILEFDGVEDYRITIEVQR